MGSVTFVSNTDNASVYKRDSEYCIVKTIYTRYPLKKGINVFDDFDYGFYFMNMFMNKNSLSIYFDDYNTSNITKMNYMFAHYPSEFLNLKNFDTSNVDSMYKMFGFCYYLKELDLSSFNTSNVMTYMFYNCCDLEYLDVSNFDMKMVAGYYEMFKGCNNLKCIKCTEDFKKWCLIHAKAIALPNHNFKWDII